MQDGEESDLGARQLGIGGQLEQGLGAGLEQQVDKTPGVNSLIEYGNLTKKLRFLTT
jgi:hypothetical protein